MDKDFERVMSLSTGTEMMAKRSYFCEQPNPNEGETITRLLLLDDRRFLYSREWCTYAWHIIKKAKGRWEQIGDVLTLHVEASEIYGVTPPATLKAVQRGNAYDFGNATVVALVLRDDQFQLREADLERDFGNEMVVAQVPPPDDASQRHEAELEEQKFKRSMNIKPSKLVK